MKRLNLTKESEAVISRYIVTMIFYLTELGNKDRKTMENIASTFCKEYEKTFYKVIEELLDEE